MKTFLASAVACVLGALLSTSATAQFVPLPGGLSVPGYGPGIAGHVDIGPIAPVCRPDIPCTRPFAGAHVEILDTLRQSVASAVSNSRGNFIVSVPSGNYIVHIRVVDFPRCPEAHVTVRGSLFALTAITCDSGIR
jgi:hypothetical protein